MISKKMVDALNKQVMEEFHSAWIYMAMAYKFEAMSLKIFAQWFFLQAQEEREHAEKMASYILDQGGEVKLTGMDAPKVTAKTAESLVKAAVDHEIYITECIHKLCDQAKKENDHATFNFLQWYVDEQVEEVASTSELYDMVKLASNPGQILMLEGRIWRMVQERKSE